MKYSCKLQNFETSSRQQRAALLKYTASIHGVTRCTRK